MGTQTQPAANIGMQAAKASWVAPIVGVFLNLTTNGPTTTIQQKMIVAIASFVIYAFGLVCAGFAMSKAKQYGSKGITAPAIVGIIINGILVFLFSVIFFLALLPHQ